MQRRDCFIIPCYQHSKTLGALLLELQKYNFKAFVVNDGSDEVNTMQITKACSEHPWVELLEHSENRGKGAAVMAGLTKAGEQGYTHAIQIDSDAQHDVSKVKELLALSEGDPTSLVMGLPQYDESVPKARLWGRYLTHFWVWVETLSFKIKDSMCGFRVYPVAATLAVINDNHIGQRMDFDIEILVRLFWAGVPMQQVPVKVVYPVGGTSSFKMFDDNCLITKMHTKLFFSMFYKMPLFFLRGGDRKQLQSRWHKTEELGSVLGMRIVFFFYRALGRKVVKILLYPICYYYYLLHSQVRRQSKSYIEVYQSYCQTLNTNYHAFTPFHHIYSFADMVLDKFSVWVGDITIDSFDSDDVAELLEISRHQGGAFFISSHYGNIEVCRAMGRFFPQVKFNALVYHDNAAKFNNYLNKLNNETALNLISIRDFSIEHSISLKEKVDKGEWVFMMGDRFSIQNNQRTLAQRFLGKKVELPEGPFLMAYLLEVPIYIIHCYRSGAQFRIQLKKVIPGAERNSKNKKEYMIEIAGAYCSELAGLIEKDPLQWYNFFNFWKV